MYCLVSSILHNVDLFWACLSTVAAAYPLYRLWPSLQQQSSRDLFLLVAICAVYPWAVAVLHLVSPLDKGLVYAICMFAIPTYMMLMLRFLGYRPEQTRLLRMGAMICAGVLAALAISNPWHGQFAVFEPMQAHSPNHLKDYSSAKAGVILTTVFQFLVIAGTTMTAAVHYARARCQTAHIVAGLLLPLLALASAFSPLPQALSQDLQINLFFVATTAALLILNYNMLRDNVLQSIPISHAQIIGSMPDAVAIIDHQQKITDYNPAFKRLLDHQLLLNKQIDTLLPAFDLEQTRQLVLGQNHYDLSVTSLRQDELRDDRLLVLRDVTAATKAYQALEQSRRDLRRANGQLERLSTTDSLTNLRNRRYFHSRLGEEITRSAHHGGDLGLLLIDVDHFKLINDNHGHQVGDSVLAQIGRVMQSQCRSEDVIARVGGEEFAVMLPNITAPAIAGVAERFRTIVQHQQIAAPGGVVLTVSVSIGALVMAKPESIDQALNRADRALYEAKDLGRNRVVVANPQPPTLATSELGRRRA